MLVRATSYLYCHVETIRWHFLIRIFIVRIAHNLFNNIFKSKSNLHYTRDITPKRVTIGGAHFHSLAPGQHSSENTSHRWPAVRDTKSALTGSGIESKTFRIDNDVFNHYQIGRLYSVSAKYDTSTMESNFQAKILHHFYCKAN